MTSKPIKGCAVALLLASLAGKECDGCRPLLLRALCLETQTSMCDRISYGPAAFTLGTVLQLV